MFYQLSGVRSWGGYLLKCCYIYCEQNVEDILPELKNLIAVGKNYQKALQSNSHDL